MQVEYQGYPWQRDIANRLWEHSAIAHVANVKTPTMFVHGELDEDVAIGGAFLASPPHQGHYPRRGAVT